MITKRTRLGDRWDRVEKDSRREYSVQCITISSCLQRYRKVTSRKNNEEVEQSGFSRIKIDDKLTDLLLFENHHKIKIIHLKEFAGICRSRIDDIKQFKFYICEPTKALLFDKLPEHKKEKESDISVC